MITGHFFPFKGQNAAWIPEFAHSSIPEDKATLYQLMYMTLGGEWTKRKIHLHLIAHLASDQLLTDILFKLGFGAIVGERIRDLSLIDNVPAGEIVSEKDISKLIDIETKHKRYYRESPIYVLKDVDPQNIKGALEQYIHDSDEILVYQVDGELYACMVVGSIAREGEGILFRHTNTAQIKSAYMKPEIRGKGIGKLLLNTAIEWARKEGFEKLFVEHETANFYGGMFWSKHFSSTIYASMRYIDNGI